MNSLISILLLLMVVIVLPSHASSKNVIEPVESVKIDKPIEDNTVPANPRIVLITIDGARWQDIFTGPHLWPLVYKRKVIPARELLPNLYQHFVDNGIVVGRDSEFVATGPMHISLPGYLEIMRGHPSFDCQSNECEPKVEDTMADLFETSAVFSSWDTIKKTIGKNRDKFVVNCGRHYRSAGWKHLGLLDKNKFPEAFDGEYRLDKFTKEAVFDYLQNNNPQFLWVSLGDTDEWAHAGDYDKYIESLVDADKFVGEMVTKLSSPDTTFIITADHGRGIDWRHHGSDVQSSKDWLMMTGRNVPKKGFIKYSGIKRLSDILATVKHLLGKPSDSSLLMGL